MEADIIYDFIITGFIIGAIVGLILSIRKRK